MKRSADSGKIRFRKDPHAYAHSRHVAVWGRYSASGCTQEQAVSLLAWEVVRKDPKWREMKLPPRLLRAISAITEEPDGSGNFPRCKLFTGMS